MLELPPAQDDGLPVMKDVGVWAHQKHHFLRRYIDAFTTAMKDKPWSGLHYIDLFAGPGILQIRETNELVWGSPMIAAQCRLFKAIHLCELRGEYCEALKSRIERLSPKPEAHIIEGDANEVVGQIVKSIPARSLSLAFLDPFGLHLDLETVKTLAANRTDLIIFFPDHLDALRNCEYVYKDQPNSNLDRFLGDGADWRAALDGARRDCWAEVLRKMYLDQLKGIGYKHFETERIRKGNAPLYLLIFCSKDEAGAKIWRGISKKKHDGQDSWPWG